MENATQSKNARRIESALLNKLATLTQKVFAERFGVAEYTVSRMKRDFFRQMSIALDILEYGVADEEMNRLAEEVAKILTKEKAPSCANSFEA
ncbi:CII family transcriptional regulator [Pantoea sp. A4]|uniref:CII family transcriptional regulator n=1 Tax=Pantoea sp. A4 TaxID=1225184 RepID=UPI00037B0D35|nr:CII family transcriptional regulator [Pantoea sp. A4]